MPCELHVVLWSHMSILICLLAEEPFSISWPLFPLSVSLWNDLADPVFNGVDSVVLWVSRAGAMHFYWPKLLYPLLSATIFPIPFFPPIGWYCVARVFVLIGCRSLSPCLPLPTSFNNNIITAIIIIIIIKN